MKIQIVNGEPWVDDDIPIDFKTREAVIVAVEEFLEDARDEAFDYTAEDIEIILDNGMVLGYTEWKELK